VRKNTGNPDEPAKEVGSAHSFVRAARAQRLHKAGGVDLWGPGSHPRRTAPGPPLNRFLRPGRRPPLAPQVLRLLAGQYFGERALLTSAKRAANVLASGRVTLLALSRSRFEAEFGSLQVRAELGAGQCLGAGLGRCAGLGQALRVAGSHASSCGRCGPVRTSSTARPRGRRRWACSARCSAARPWPRGCRCGRRPLRLALPAVQTRGRVAGSAREPQYPQLQHGPC
jgi:hypothetical protein